jgi:hypothetical protein
MVLAQNGRFSISASSLIRGQRDSLGAARSGAIRPWNSFRIRPSPQAYTSEQKPLPIRAAVSSKGAAAWQGEAVHPATDPVTGIITGQAYVIVLG